MEQEQSWQQPIMEYLTAGKLPGGEKEGKANEANSTFLHYSGRETFSPRICSAIVEVYGWKCHVPTQDMTGA